MGCICECYFEDRKGKLYYFSPEGSVSIIEEGVGCSNGMGFSPDLKTILYGRYGREIYAYDFNLENSQLSNRRLLRKLIVILVSRTV